MFNKCSHVRQEKKKKKKKRERERERNIKKSKLNKHNKGTIQRNTGYKKVIIVSGKIFFIDIFGTIKIK